LKQPRPDKRQPRLAGAPGSCAIESALLIVAPAGWLLARLSTVEEIGRIAGACWVHSLLGIPCPTCGATRAALALAHGDWSAAMTVQPLATALAVLVASYLPWAVGVVFLGWTPLRLDLRGASGRAWRWGLVLVGLANWGYLIRAGV